MKSIKRVFFKTRRGKILAIILLIVISYLTVSIISTPIICRGIFNYHSGEYSYTLSEANSKGYIRTQISRELNAYVLLSNETDKLLVIVGGIDSTPDTHLKEAELFFENGWNICILDCIKNETDGTLRGFTDIELDIEKALSSVAYGKKTVLYGYSAGGNGVLCASCNSNVCGVISVCGFNSPLETMCYYGRQRASLFADIQYPFMYAYERLVFGEKIEFTAIKALNSSSVPALIIEAENDEVVPEKLGVIARQSEITNESVRCVTLKASGEKAHTDVLYDGDTLKTETAEMLLKFANSCVEG